MLERRGRGECPFCGVRVDLLSFKDDASRKEFDLSGLCQDCQDGFFDGMSGKC